MEGCSDDLAWCGVQEEWRKDDLSIDVIALMHSVGISGDSLGLTNQRRLLKVLTSYVDHGCDARKEEEMKKTEEATAVFAKKREEEEDKKRRNTMPVTDAQILALEQQELQRIAAEKKKEEDKAAAKAEVERLMAEASILNRSGAPTMDTPSKSGCFMSLISRWHKTTRLKLKMGQTRVWKSSRCWAMPGSGDAAGA